MKVFKNIRKIVVGDNFTHSIKYVVGVTYNLGSTKAKLSNIIQDQDNPEWFDLFVLDSENECSIYWKSVKDKQILDIENDVNFE